MNPFGFYARGRLHRKIFLWFGVSIAITAGVVLLVSGRHDKTWGIERAQTFMARQFVEAWDDPPRRDAFASALARDLEVGVRVVDERTKATQSFGAACEKGAQITRVERRGELLGQVHVCEGRPHSPHFIIPVLVAIFMLWAASGAISRRLVRPLYELSRVAHEIGRGHLKSRVRLSRRHGLEFRVVGDVMNDMAGRIEKQLADQRALLATVSHEIRTPLSRMRLLIEFARQKAENNFARLGEQAEPLGELEKLEREITEIDVLVSDLLASSRIDFTAMTKKRLDAIEVAKTALDRAAVDASKLAPCEGPIPFEGDPTLVARAVSNLLENAERHAGGVDTLRIDVRPSLVAFIVEDSGQGFELGEERRVFEPFYKKATDEQSVGLGLALVKKIAEAHGGRVFAENRPTGGARVGVEFSREGLGSLDPPTKSTPA
ncbi:MAG TPA: HAMP domain-containing sensor histidine kinase [Polyangiaceae bacterium]|nr:HAMP domain-containing sensor histidine kinase [Polyangiaceae bacterium]